LNEDLTDFTNDPHKAICGTAEQKVLNLVSGQNDATRTASVEVCHEKPENIKKVYHQIVQIQEKNKANTVQLSLFGGMQEESNKEPLSGKSSSILTMPTHHAIPSPKYLDKMLYKMYENPPETYQGLLELQGVGPSTLRALAMVAEITHGAQPTFQDPVRYAFAHGGKDNYPFPVERNDMEQSLSVLRRAIEKGKIGEKEKLQSLKRLTKQEESILNG
jgi:hypothetical protein